VHGAKSSLEQATIEISCQITAANIRGIYSNADVVETAIKAKLTTLCEQPESSPPDKYKLNNKGNRFRAFETHSFRVAYRFTEKEIRVLRVRSTHQEPKMY